MNQNHIKQSVRWIESRDSAVHEEEEPARSLSGMRRSIRGGSGAQVRTDAVRQVAGSGHPNQTMRPEERTRAIGAALVAGR